MNSEAAPFIYRALPHDRVCQPGSVSFPTPATETMMARLTTSIDSIVTKSSLPPLDVVKFSGNPCEYFSNRVLRKWLIPRTFQKLRKCRVYCSFWMA